MKITEGAYVNSAGTEVVVTKRCSDMSINYPFHCILPTGSTYTVTRNGAFMNDFSAHPRDLVRRVDDKQFNYQEGFT